VGKSGGTYPAADDKASGAAGLLEVSRVLGDYSFDRTLVVFFSTGEEQGSLGVKQYLGNLSNDVLEHIAYVVNVDMIGYDANGDRVMQLWHGNHALSIALAQRMSEIIDSQELDLRAELTAGCG
jgi:Zn-dependent M28 family amino/carboxypeptidase